MSKIDKFLYGGFAVVAVGVVVAMLVTVFSPPKQPVEETVKTSTPPKIEQATPEPVVAVEPTQPATEYGVRYFDDNGNEIIPTQEILDAFKALDEERKRKEEEQKAPDEAEKKWWESRKDWVERFPFQPTRNHEVPFDPTAYQPGKAAEWPEEKKDKAYWDMKKRVENHGFLRNFYESWLPYTEEFEQMYDIVTEEIGGTDNTIALGWTFNTLKKYHQAAQRDPDAIFRENVRMELPVPEADELLEQEFVLGEDFFSLPEEGQQVYIAALLELRRKAIKDQMDPPTERRDVTWGEETEMLKECLLGPLGDLQIGEERIPEEQALAIRERLINEIPAAGFLEMGKKGLRYVQKYEFELKPGDPLLIK